MERSTHASLRHLSTRPDTIWLEAWPRLSKKPKREEIANWDEDKVHIARSSPKRMNLRRFSEDTDYLKVVPGAQAKLEKCIVLSMRCIPKGRWSAKPDAMPIFERPRKPDAVNVSKGAGTVDKPRKHMDFISEKGSVSEFHCGVVRKPIASKVAMKVLDAQAEGEKEWDQLQNVPAWDFNKFKVNSEVVQQAKKDGRSAPLPSQTFRA